MSKKLPKKYYSEEAVKKALNIDSFRNLSKDKVMEFTSMIPYMDKDVAIEAIKKFPDFASFGKTAVQSYSSTCKEIIKSNNESQKAVVKAYQTILDGLKTRLESDSISEEERDKITDKMIEIAGEVARADLNNKQFLDRISKRLTLGLIGAVAFIGAGLGIHATFGGGNLPQIEDDEDYEEK